MIRLKDEYWIPVQEKIQNLLWFGIFNPLFGLMAMEKPYENAYPSHLIQAIKDGLVRYKNGVFSGEFNIAISRELAEFATFSRMAKCWVGIPDSSVISAAIMVEREGQALNEQAARMLPALEIQVTKAIEGLQFSMKETLFALNDQAKDDLRSLAVLPELTAQMADNLERDYTFNQRLNIVDWAPQQIERLRKVIQENALSGYNRNELAEFIQSEWNVSFNKARFLARQETSLFVSNFRDQRYQSAGVEKYRWSSSQDARCRVATQYAPAHGPGGLHGKVFRFDDPPVSGTKGEKQNPGIPFGCRCVAVPVL